MSGRLLAIKWLKIDGEDMEIPEWRTDTGDAENYGEEPADAHAEGDDYTDDTAQQQPPQPRGQRLQPQTQQQRQGQPQRQPQVRQNAPQRQAQPQQGQQGFRRRNSAA